VAPHALQRHQQRAQRSIDGQRTPRLRAEKLGAQLRRGMIDGRGRAATQRHDARLQQAQWQRRRRRKDLLDVRLQHGEHAAVDARLEAKSVRHQRRHGEHARTAQRRHLGVDRGLAAAAPDVQNLKECRVPVGLDLPAVAAAALGNRLAVQPVRSRVGIALAVQRVGRQSDGRHDASVFELCKRWWLPSIERVRRHAYAARQETTPQCKPKSSSSVPVRRACCSAAC
jgi:hypothetical protein